MARRLVACRKACSQMRRTRQPVRRKVRFTTLSRVLLADNFRCQNARLFFGLVACLGQPCQKQPSTKSASRTRLKTKSGLTLKSLAPCFLILTSNCLRHPEILFPRSNRASASSVSLFPRLRTRDINSERVRFPNVVFAYLPRFGQQLTAIF